MSMDIRKSFIYKYTLYRFKQTCLRSKVLAELSQEDKERICMETAKKTRKRMLFIGLVYFFAMSFLNMKIISDPSQNAFTRWYTDTLYSLYPLIGSHWGLITPEGKGVVLLVCIKALPVFLIDLLPLLLIAAITVNIFIKRIERDILHRLEEAGPDLGKKVE